MLKQFAFALLYTAALVFGHSHLANPLPTRRLDCRVGNGRPRDCPGPCPPLDTYGEPTGISPNRPAETWRRGEKRWVSWHRNNHGNGESGFVRFTLVPVDKMMDKAAHERFTFQISCWSSGLHNCGSRHERVCGNDADGKAYRVEITVPSAYPDGVYVFGWAWYGGGDFRGKSFFGDYYSCSFVRISGGKAVSAESKPVFRPGLNQKHNDACVSAADRVGVCWREPCHNGQVRPMKPRGLPRFIRSRDLGNSGPQENREPESSHTNSNGGNARGARGSRNRFQVSGIQVYDLRTNRVKFNAKGNFKVKLSAFRKGFAVGLQVSGNVSKVIFRIRGHTHEEKVAPYIVNGNHGRKMERFRCRRRQKVRFTASVYGSDGSMKDYKYTVTCA